MGRYANQRQGVSLRPFATWAVRAILTALVVAASVVTGSLIHAADLPPISLPSWRTDEVAQTVTVAPWTAGDAKLTIANPAAGHHKGGVGRYEIDPQATGGRWSVMAIDKRQMRTAVGTFAAAGDKLTFAWEKNPNRALAGGLRNCMLTIARDGGEQRVALRTAQIVEPALLDFRKDFLSVPIKGEDLPDDTALKFEVLNLTDAPATAAFEKKATPAKEPQFIVLKPTEPDVPGVRLRLLLTENGSQLNFLVRPELTPAKPDAAMPTFVNLATGTTSKQSTKTGSPAKTNAPIKTGTVKATNNLSGNAGATVNNNEPNLLFTTRKLAESKSQLQTQLQNCKQRILADQSGILQRQTELNNIPSVIIGTAAEIAATEAKIARLRSEISLLRNEIMQLERLVPEYERSLTAFPPLEKLGSAMQQKTAVSLRVYYLVEATPVEVLRVGK